MKKLYFFMLAMMAVIAANATTVYFENTANWPTVCAYAWSPNNADWPGVIVTETVNVTVQGSNATKTLYKYELPAAQTQIIFNNNNKGAQTTDLPATDGAVYSFAANSNSKYPIGTVSGNKFIPAGEVEITYGKIYVPVKMYDHSTAYIYSWSPAMFGGWPGKQMTKVTENGIDFWMVEVDETDLPATVGGWVLNQGSDEGKTGDLPPVTFQKDYVYEPTGTVTPLADYRQGDDVIVYAIHGQIFGNESWQSYDMTEENGVWSYTGNAVPGSFGIKKMVNGSQTDWYAAKDDAQMAEAKEYYAKVNGNNWNSTLVGTYTFTFDPEAMTLTVTAGGNVEEPTITYALKGTIFGEDWASYEMTEKDGVWSYTGNAQLGDFGIQKLANGSQIDWLFAEGDNVMKANDVYPVTNTGGANWNNMLTGEVTFAFDPAAMTLTVSGGTYVEVEKKWYVSYNINNADWVFNQEMQADPTEEGIYYADFDNMTAEKNYFTFTDAPMNNWTVAPGGSRYGCEGGSDVEIEVDKTYNLQAGSDKCFVTAAGNARITLNANDMTIKCSGKLLTAISTIEAESNAAAEYFNLQGVRIANPVKGQLVIERRGTVATKRIF